MAALYQAALQTILTRSEINQMSYNDVKIRIGEILGMDETSSKSAKDIILLEEFYKGTTGCPKKHPLVFEGLQLRHFFVRALLHG